MAEKLTKSEMMKRLRRERAAYGLRVRQIYLTDREFKFVKETVSALRRARFQELKQKNREGIRSQV